MKPDRKRAWVLAALAFIIVALSALLLYLNQRPEPLVSAFLTKLYTVEDPALVSALYEKVELELQRNMKRDGSQGVVVLEGNEDPLYVHYSAQYGSFCTKDGFEKMIASRVFDQYARIAVRRNWKLEARPVTLDPHTENQFGYTVDVTVTDVATGAQKTVSQIGVILVKRTLFGYKVQTVRMQSRDLMDPQPGLF
ncbi:MAG TPA: hypothetical protein VN366_03220 [Feifaniaceae bacterium]|nr:hypothetical protein [Feifaniaceae bacterium]